MSSRDLHNDLGKIAERAYRQKTNLDSDATLITQAQEAISNQKVF